MAWQIFQEVNHDNDLTKHLDLSCLDYEDALVITKQQMYELAKYAARQSSYEASHPQAYVVNVKCAEDHLILMEDPYGRTPLKNCVLEMIKNDLKLENYYIPTHRIILVKIDHLDLKRLDQRMSTYDE